MLQVVLSPLGLARNQESLILKGTLSPFCFFNRLAAFFSLGVKIACFFGSLLVRLVFDILFIPGHVSGTLAAAQKGFCPFVPISSRLFGAVCVTSDPHMGSDAIDVGEVSS